MITIHDFEKLDIRVGKIKENLENKLILGLINMPPKRIGPFTSEFLTLGVSDKEGKCILVSPEKKVFLGAKLY